MKRYPYSRHKPCTATMQAHRDGPSAHKQDTSDDSSSANYIPIPIPSEHKLHDPLAHT